MNPEIAIKVTNLSKHYAIGKQKDDSLRGALASLFAIGKKKTENFKALDGINFEINKGDVVGIIGKNGAGKSTLLKILSQITQPTKGRIEINGRIASLLEVGTGFHPELTGRENIYLNGTILGMTRSEVKSKFDEIVEFSGVEKFIDTPVKHYSSGMYVRLAFAVAAHLEPEILIIDEVLAVGDAEFQKKCLGKMKDVAGEGRTVIFVSHDMTAVKKLCDKAILFQKGVLLMQGETHRVISEYNQNQFEAKDYFNHSPNLYNDYEVLSIQIKNNRNESNHVFSIFDEIEIIFDIHIKENNSPYSIYVCIKNINGSKAFSIDKEIKFSNHKFIIEEQCLTRGYYTLDVFIQSSQLGRLVVLEDITLFQIIDQESELAKHGNWDYGNTFGKYRWI